MTTLTTEQPLADLPAGQYRARVARSYGEPGRCRIGTPTRPLASLSAGRRHTQSVALIDHPGGPIGLVADDGVRPVVELTRVKG